MFDLGRTFLATVERSPDEVAIVDGARRLTYAQWFEHIRRVAGGLDTIGVGRGDRLLVVLQNRWEAATIHWASQMAGAVVTPVNWRAKGEEIEYCARDAGARAVVFEPVSADAVRRSPAAQSIPRVGVGGADGATLTFDDLLAAPPRQARLDASPDDLSLMLYTSGTTGRPKGVPRRHSHERAAAVAHVAQNLYRRGERTLGVMPLYHTMGVRSLLAMALVDGRFVCAARFDAGAALEAIEAEQITCLYLVPTLYHDLLNHPDCTRRDLRSVRKLGFAGAPMAEGLLKRLDERFAPDLFVNHYGSTEIYTFTVEQDAGARPGSAGRAGLNQRIRVVRLDAAGPDDVAPPGEEGQIIADLAGDEAFEGYWNRPDADRAALRGGWYFTGDMGYLDPAGHVYVTGRVDDMIKETSLSAALVHPAAGLLTGLDGFRVEVDEARERADVILDRPPYNIVSMQQRDQLRAVFEALDAAPAVRVIVLRAAGQHFSSGGDIGGFMDASPEHVSHLAWNVAAPARCSKPVIAANRGYTFGVGFEISLACDFRLASETTLYALPEQTLGQIPGSGGSARLQKMIGVGRTKDLVMRSRRITGTQAYDWGIASDCVKDAELEQATDTLVAELRELSPLAQRMLKQLLNDTEDASLSTAIELEGHCYSRLRASEDFAEGVKAFREKRKPRFTGR